ncbi:MAG: hypothetical protein PHG65_06765 [Kiritimatiellae bacterium]|nr:hypothetical protein [Kiritimatiellia bacterium]
MNTLAAREENKADVEQIVHEISAGLHQAGTTRSHEPSPDEPVHNLQALLREINQSHRVALPPAEGVKGRLRTRLYALLAQPFESINRFHLLTLHTLNKLVKVLDGSNDDLEGELLTQTRNRLDLIETLSHRIADLETKVTSLEQRLESEKAPR